MWDTRIWSHTFTASEPSWVQAMMTENLIADETSLFNTGYHVKMKKFVTLEILDIQKTGYTDFKKYYKFISLQVNVNDVQLVHARITKDLFTALGDFGGLLSILQAVCMFFFANFSYTKLLSIITNRFFTWEVKDGLEEEHEHYVCCF